MTKKILVLFWPQGGSVHKCAGLIHEMLDTNEADLVELTEFNPQSFNDYSLVIVGCSTVGADSWKDASKSDEWGPFFARMNKDGIDLKGIKVALYGLGNQVLYPDHFINSTRIIHDELKQFNPTFIGKWPIEGYSFNDSEALVGDHFLGLALDEDTEGHLTEQRIEGWLGQILEEAE